MVRAPVRPRKRAAKSAVETLTRDRRHDTPVDMEKLKTALVGAGKVARLHAAALRTLPESEFVAVCSRPSEKLNAFCAEHGVRAFHDVGEMIEQAGVQALCICTPHPNHAAPAIAAARAGVHVLVEKPMAMSMKECGLIVNAVRQHGNKLMVGYNRRFAPSMLDVKKAYDKRKGEALITYRIVADRKRYGGGRLDMKKWGGDLLGETCHIFDLMRWLTGKEPSTLYCSGGREDNSITTMRFGDQVVSIISGGIGDLRYPKERLEIFRDRSTIVLDYFAAGYYIRPLLTKE